MTLTYSKLTREQTDKLLEHFIAGTTARTVASLLNINKNTATLFYTKLRQIIYLKTIEEKNLQHIIKTDWRYYFEILNKDQRKDEIKYPLFAVMQLDGKMYTALLNEENNGDSSTNPEPHELPDVIVCSNLLIRSTVFNVNQYYPYRLNSPSNINSQRHYIDGIENFWKLMKNHFPKFNGISIQTLPLFLKELEWRYNYREPKILLKILSSWII